MIRAAVAFLLLTAPAAAGCIVDDKAAAQAFTIIAFTRMCPEYRAADDKAAMSILASLEAIDTREETTVECRVLVSRGIAAASARSAFSAKAREAECSAARKWMARDDVLRDVLDIFHLLRKPTDLTPDQENARLDKEIQDALKAKGEYVPK